MTTFSGLFPVTSNSITYVTQGNEFKGDLTINGSDIDWSTGIYKDITLVGTTTYTFSNLQKGKTILLRITGSFTLAFPTSCELVNAGTYDGTKYNYIVLNCVNSSSPKVLMAINKTA
jgi:hypothetical protein